MFLAILETLAVGKKPPKEVSGKFIFVVKKLREEIEILHLLKLTKMLIHKHAIAARIDIYVHSLHFTVYLN